VRGSIINPAWRQETVFLLSSCKPLLRLTHSPHKQPSSSLTNIPAGLSTGEEPKSAPFLIFVLVHFLWGSFHPSKASFYDADKDAVVANCWMIHIPQQA